MPPSAIFEAGAEGLQIDAVCMPALDTTKIPLQTTRSLGGKPKQTKSRNGCATCKGKRLKCDERKPGCEMCERRGVECGGYKKVLKWKALGEEAFIGGRVPGRVRKGTREGLEKVGAGVEGKGMGGKGEDGVGWEMNGRGGKIGESIADDLGNKEGETGQLSFGESAGGLAMLDGEDESSWPLFEMPAEEEDVGGILESHDEEADIIAHHPGDSLQRDDIRDVSRTSEPFEWAIKEQHIIAHFANLQNLITANTRSPLHLTLHFRPDSQESLLHTYTSQTCGILSITDGPSENPWRTLIYPLALSSPPLYHALLSMTAFHLAASSTAGAAGAPAPISFRALAVRHLSTSLSALHLSLSAPALPTTEILTDLATTLTLAFAESWDWGTRSGISHLRGSRVLVCRALAAHAQTPFQGGDLSRLRFLGNTWMYLDVLAQLTSICDMNCEIDFAGLLAPLNQTRTYGPAQDPTRSGDPALFPSMEGKLPLDPLLGCSRTLFPILARVATLLKKVRLHQNLSGLQETPLPHTLIAWATQLQRELENWDSGSMAMYAQPVDEPQSVCYSLATAETYRLVTLMLLYQAVPCLAPSPTANATAESVIDDLARSVMELLDSTPIGSRVVIIQIFPLLVAGCEAMGRGQREWVRERWRGMKGRMWIGNLECCSDVVEEVWRRRDGWVGGEMGRERGLGGRLHWASVMREWKWEVLLG